MDHQDWKPVIVRKNKNSNNDKTGKNTTYKASQKQQKDASIEKKAEN